LNIPENTLIMVKIGKFSAPVCAYFKTKIKEKIYEKIHPLPYADGLGIFGF
jgi:hypothetical protein